LIALTAYGQDEDRRRAKEVGFDEHLAKQADPVELAALITAG
jgi:CheY-like chemotaxis protein